MSHPMLDVLKANNYIEYDSLADFEALTVKTIGYFAVKKRNNVINPALYYYDGTTAIQINSEEFKWESFFE